MSDTDWEVYPQGLRVVLDNFSRFGVPLFVTENGVATVDETLRRDFIREHLKVVADAHRAGCNVIGYLYWSLMDNYEWTMGTAPRFGLAGVDPVTWERRPRPSVDEFAKVCRENRLNYMN
jgi:beta-glucosidase